VFETGKHSLSILVTKSVVIAVDLPWVNSRRDNAEKGLLRVKFQHINTDPVGIKPREFETDKLPLSNLVTVSVSIAIVLPKVSSNFILKCEAR